MRRAILGVIIIIILGAAILAVAVPVVLAGGNWTVKVTKVSFTSNVDTTKNPRVTFGPTLTSNSTTTLTALEYYYSNRSGGTVSTTNISVNSTAGNFTGFMSWFLNNPSNQTVAQGNFTFAGGFGNRTHTFTFSADQGVRASGMYRLTVLLSGSGKPLGGSAAGVANTTRYTWKVP